MACAWAVAGCGAGQRGEEAGAAAEAFVAALAEGDGAAACGLLSPEAVEQVVSQEGKDCEAAVLALGLPAEASGTAEVWGDRAQVKTGSDVLFLAELEDGWKVVAAGCAPQGERPYECEVEG
ncbi:hypothetical protein [Glycomyces artemisiae]|uniref:Uncharacterized protein n=1 Tax=Glycomyces artemisiae TaxID=1076443 RepID=A0A2T0UED2_9ACTN|nr:hypothetical protein [Glycomyces artemisiae]PRY56273.1 hypothetical protein B0I28_110156 [Glycomyces artemisiae]